MEHELLSLSSDSWTDVQQPNPCTPTVIQGFAEHVCLLTDDPIEDFSEDDHMAAAGSIAVAGRSPKHSRTGSEEDSVDITALLDRAADRFSACMDTKVDSMMDRLENRIDEKIDSKLGPVMDRLSVLERTSSSTRSGPSSLSDNGGSAGQSSAAGGTPAVFALSFLEIKGWCGLRDRNTHGLTEAQGKEIITKLRQGIGPDLDSLIARVGALRVRNTKIICFLKTPSLSSCKQIRESMNAFIEKENIKLGPQLTTPFVTEEKPAWRQEQQRTFGKALRVAEQLATMKAKYITSEWYPFYQVYVHESESAQPIPLLRTTSGAQVATAEGAELLGITADKLVIGLLARCSLTRPRSTQD